MLKTFARGIGLDPESILTRESLAEPHTVYASASEARAIRRIKRGFGRFFSQHDGLFFCVCAVAGEGDIGNLALHY
jgi:hypothetical protein